LASLIKNWSLEVFPSFSAFLRANQSDGSVAKQLSSLPDLLDSYYCPPNAMVPSGSRVTSGLLRGIQPQDVVRRRRENYAHLRHSLIGTTGLSFLWAEELLPDGMCPLALPVLVDNKSRWCDQLNAAGVVVSPWWAGFHTGLDWSEFPEAVTLKAQLILLPVHQGLSTRHMAYAASVIRSLAR
jgi:hypothetical protein